MEDMSSTKYPRIARANEQVQGGWQGYVNKMGREGSDPIIREAFTVKLNGEETTDNEGPSSGTEADMGERPECG